MKKTEPRQRRFSLLRGLAAAGKFFVKIIAAILAVVIFFGGICACVGASVLLVDVISSSEYSYSQRLISFVDRNMEKLLGRKAAPAVSAAESNRRYAAALVSEINSLAQHQQSIDELLLAELNSGDYTLDAPFILNDPYGNSPMTAVILFKTEQPAKVSVHIAGDTKLAEVDFSFSDYNTDHIIPVYGLYAGRDNAVTLRVRTQDGVLETKELTVTTDVLPAILENDVVQAHVLNEQAYQKGFTFTYMGSNSNACKAALDANGEYRWVLDFSAYGRIPSGIGYCANYNNSESIFIRCGSHLYGPVVIMELNHLGKLLGAWYAPYGAHHDIEVTPDDTVLITGCADDEVREDFLYEIDLETGEIITTLDYSNILQVNRDQTQYAVGGDEFYSFHDWFHMNTITTHGDQLIVSARNQSTVICNDREGNIKWMLGDPEDYYEYYQQYLLKPVGDNFVYFYTQHAPEVMPDQDGNPDTLDIILFDNGDFRLDTDKVYSRMVQYRINEKDMTVEQIWSYGEEKPELYSHRHGDADLLKNGNRLGSFEPYNKRQNVHYAYSVEVTENNEPVWECWRMSPGTSPDYSEYRLERLEIYSDAANTLHLGEAARLFLPEFD